MKLCTTLFTGTLVVCLCAVAHQSLGTCSDSEIALLRSDIQSKKTLVLQQKLTLSEEQAKKFWPLQRTYETDLSKMFDQHLDVIREYTKNSHNLSDVTAKDLGKRLLSYEKKRVELRNRYFDRISKEISPIVAAKFFQIEIQMEDVIDLQIASSVPLIK